MRLFLLCFILLSNIASAQILTDSLYFFSQGEKKHHGATDTEGLFKQFWYASTDTTATPLASYSSFVQFIGELKNETAGKKELKTINTVYKAVHERYFDKYILNPDFTHIFTKNEYNCVTATALYSIVLDALDIPFEIREMPTHVYLLAYPETERVVLESTNPVNGSQNIKPKDIEKYKQNLINSKQISDSEANKLEESDLVNTYILSDSIISVANLLGLQYYNNSVKAYEAQSLKTAYIQNSKAMHLHETADIKAWTNTLIFQLIETEHNNLTTDELSSLISVFFETNYDSFLKSPKSAINYYISFGNKIIDEGNKIEVFDNINSSLYATCDDNLNKELHNTGTLLSAEYYYKTLQPEKALKQLTQANDVPPEFRLMIKHCLGQHFMGISDPIDGLDSLSKYEQIFPFMQEDEIFMSIGVWCFAKIIYQAYSNNNAKKGELWLNKFREKYQATKDKRYPTDEIGSIYGSASSYYVRKVDYKKAKALLEEGLKYAPKSGELSRKMKYMN